MTRGWSTAQRQTYKKTGGSWLTFMAGGREEKRLCVCVPGGGLRTFMSPHLGVQSQK